MAATFLKLKLSLLKNSFKRNPWQLVGMIVGLLYGLGIVSLLIYGMVQLGQTSVQDRAWVLTIFGSVMVIGWWFIPVFTATLDSTVDLKSFTTYPIGKSKLMAGLVVAGLIGVPSFLTVLLLIGCWLPWLTSPIALVFAIAGSFLALMLIQFGVRTITTFLSGVLSGRRAKEFIGMLLLLLLITVGPLASILINQLTNLADFDGIRDIVIDAAGVLGWTPFGAGFYAAFDAAEGNILIAVVKLVYVAAVIVLLSLLWSRFIDKAMTNPPSEKVKLASTGKGFLDNLQNSPTTAIMVKTIRYSRRDSRLMISNFPMIVLPAILVVFYLVGLGDVKVPTELVLAAPVILAAMYGWGLHNMIAYDGSAYWSLLSIGVRGKADRIGRMLFEGGFGLALILIVTVALIWLTGVWAMLLPVFIAAFSVLLVTIGVSTFISTLWIYAVPEPGGNPFNTPSGGAGLTMLAQFVSLGVVAVVSIPVVGLFLAVLLGGPELYWLTWIMIPVGMLVSVAVIWLGIRLGAKRIDTRGPEILVALQKFS